MEITHQKPRLDQETPLEPDIYLHTETILNQLAIKIVNLRLHTPVLFLLEAHLPIASIGYTIALILEPIAVPLFGKTRIESLKLLLLDRKNIERLAKLIETHST